MKKIDSHSHTLNSIDASFSIDEMCVSAIEKGVSGLTVSDHADIFDYEGTYSYERICRSVKSVDEARKRYGDKLLVLKGVELGDIYADRTGTKELLKIDSYDVLLGSVHAVPFEDVNDFCSQISFDEKCFSNEKINGFLREYFKLIRNMIEYDDIDVVCHLLYPTRYMIRKYGRKVDLSLFSDQIEDILKAIIEKGLSLEVNVSGFDGEYDPCDSFSPGEDVLKRYFALGGRMITIGSDAHSPDKVANRFDEAARILKGYGFTSYYYYQSRKPIEVPFD